MGIFIAGGVCFHRGRVSEGPEVPFTEARREEVGAVAKERDEEGRDLVQRAQMKGARGVAMVQ